MNQNAIKIKTNKENSIQTKRRKKTKLVIINEIEKIETKSNNKRKQLC